VIAAASAVVAPRGVLSGVRSQPPLTLRQVHSDRPDTCALQLVGSAAGPLADDDLSLEVEVLPGAVATLRATGASVAQGRAGQGPSRVRTALRVGPGAALAGDTGPLVVSSGSAVHVDLQGSIAAGGRLDWQELIVLGRSGEPAGSARLRWNVISDGRPLLRHTLHLSPGAASVIGGYRVVASALLVFPHRPARTVVLSPTAVAARLADDAVLLTVLADDAATASDQMQALRAALPD
jgi:urease accessory protein